MTTGPDDTQGRATEVVATEADALVDGHTIDELAEYLDAGMRPADMSIDDSPACQNALAALVRLRQAARDSLEAAALEEAPADEGWIGGILAGISIEARAGRDIPLRSRTTTEAAMLTEGAVRALVRRAGDEVDGLLIGRCSLEGDLDVPGAPVRVRITASIVWGHSIPEVVDRLRAAVVHELLEHTELAIAGIDVTVRDVHLGRAVTDDDTAAIAGPADGAPDEGTDEHEGADAR